MRKSILLIDEAGNSSIITEPSFSGKRLYGINLNDKNEKSIFVGDILYCKELDTYFTVFEMPGGYCIESNPKSFGLYDENDPLPCVESTADPQTASFIIDSCEVIGNKFIDKDLYKRIKDEYNSRKIK